MEKPIVIAMIPARMGSVRLPRKNLRHLNGVPLITRAIRKCRQASVFDSIWVNSEHLQFSDIAKQEQVYFHHRPESLADDKSTSEQFIANFFLHHPCDYLVQVHSIAPLLSVDEIRDFVKYLVQSGCSTLLSVDNIQIECAFLGNPVNFSFREKTNSQDLSPVHRMSWSISSWHRETFLDAFNNGQCATYSGDIEFFTVSPLAGHVIKTEQDLKIAEALLPLIDTP